MKRLDDLKQLSKYHTEAKEEAENLHSQFMHLASEHCDFYLADRFLSGRCRHDDAEAINCNPVICPLCKEV